MKDFGAFLLEKRIVQPTQLEQVSTSESEATDPVYYRLLRKFPELEEAIWQALADFMQVKLVDPAKLALEPQLSRLVPARVAHQYSIAPIARRGTILDVALADPCQFDKCDEFSMLLNPMGQGQGQTLTVVPHLAKPSDVAKIIKAAYGIGADTVQDVIEDQSAETDGETVSKLDGP